MLQYLQHEERCQVIQVSFSWSLAAWLYFYKKTIIEPPIKMHPSIIQRVHCIKIGVFSHIRTPILIQSWGAFSCPRNVVNSRKTGNRKTITSQYSLKTCWKTEKSWKWGAKVKTIEKAIAFFLALFSIEGCILKSNVDTRKTSIMDAFRAAVLWELQAVNYS